MLATAIRISAAKTLAEIILKSNNIVSTINAHQALGLAAESRAPRRTAMTCRQGGRPLRVAPDANDRNRRGSEKTSRKAGEPRSIRVRSPAGQGKENGINSTTVSTCRPIEDRLAQISPA